MDQREPGRQLAMRDTYVAADTCSAFRLIFRDNLRPGTATAQFFSPRTVALGTLRGIQVYTAPVSPAAARFSSPTPSASPSRCRSMSICTARARCRRTSSRLCCRSWCASRRAASASIARFSAHLVLQRTTGVIWLGRSRSFRGAQVGEFRRSRASPTSMSHARPL